MHCRTQGIHIFILQSSELAGICPFLLLFLFPVILDFSSLPIIYSVFLLEHYSPNLPIIVAVHFWKIRQGQKWQNRFHGVARCSTEFGLCCFSCCIGFAGFKVWQNWGKKQGYRIWQFHRVWLFYKSLSFLFWIKSYLYNEKRDLAHLKKLRIK